MDEGSNQFHDPFVLNEDSISSMDIDINALEKVSISSMVWFYFGSHPVLP